MRNLILILIFVVQVSSRSLKLNQGRQSSDSTCSGGADIIKDYGTFGVYIKSFCILDDEGDFATGAAMCNSNKGMQLFQITSADDFNGLVEYLDENLSIGEEVNFHVDGSKLSNGSWAFTKGTNLLPASFNPTENNGPCLEFYRRPTSNVLVGVACSLSWFSVCEYYDFPSDLGVYPTTTSTLSTTTPVATTTTLPLSTTISSTSTTSVSLTSNIPTTSSLVQTSTIQTQPCITCTNTITSSSSLSTTQIVTTNQPISSSTTQIPSTIKSTTEATTNTQIPSTSTTTTQIPSTSTSTTTPTPTLPPPPVTPSSGNPIIDQALNTASSLVTQIFATVGSMTQRLDRIQGVLTGMNSSVDKMFSAFQQILKAVKIRFG